jgi:Flp pilus assembly pilin Flp
MSRTTEALLRRFLALRIRAEDGATAVEYAMIVALIAGVIILAVTAVGVKTGESFSKIIDAWE